MCAEWIAEPDDIPVRFLSSTIDPFSTDPVSGSVESEAVTFSVRIGDVLQAVHGIIAVDRIPVFDQILLT